MNYASEVYNQWNNILKGTKAGQIRETDFKRLVGWMRLKYNC